MGWDVTYQAGCSTREGMYGLDMIGCSMIVCIFVR